MNARHGTGNQDDNLNQVIPYDAVSTLLNGSLNRILDGKRGLIPVSGGSSLSWVQRGREDGLGQNDGLLKSNSDNQEGQSFGKKDDVDWNAQLHGDNQTEEQGESRGEKDAGSKPKVGAHAAHREEKRNESEMHGEVAQSHDDDIQSFGILYGLSARTWSERTWLRMLSYVP